MKFSCFAIGIALALITGCATTKDKANTEGTSKNQAQSQTTSIDPFEKYNRNVFRMNMALDSTIIRPTTILYITYVPDPAQSITRNFFNNLRDFVALGNDILQLNGMRSLSGLMRISINSTIGIFGLIDVSSSLGLASYKNTFGNTMKVYGWKHSSYFVIPFLGPSTVRDTLGIIPDTYFNPTWVIFNNDYISVGLFAINAIDTRSKYLDTDKLLYTSLDPYLTMRDLYLQSINEIPETPNNNDVNIDNLLDEPIKGKAK